MSYYKTNGGNFVKFRQAALKLAHEVRYQLKGYNYAKLQLRPKFKKNQVAYGVCM